MDRNLFQRPSFRTRRKKVRAILKDSNALTAAERKDLREYIAQLETFANSERHRADRAQTSANTWSKRFLEVFQAYEKLADYLEAYTFANWPKLVWTSLRSINWREACIEAWCSTRRRMMTHYGNEAIYYTMLRSCQDIDRVA